MEVWLAVLCVGLSVAGIVASCLFLRTKKILKIIAVVVFSIAALAFACYIGLTAILLDAASNKPPTEF